MSYTDQSHPRAVRDPDRRWIGGVAAGIADHLGVSIALVRAIFIALAGVGGLGAFAYLALWVLLPMGQFTSDPSPRRSVGADPTVLLALVSLAVGSLLMAQRVGLDFPLTGYWAILAVAGIGLLWRQADDARRTYDSDTPTANARATDWSTVVGAAFVCIGVFGIAAQGNSWVDVARAILVGALLLGGLVLVGLPWLANWARRVSDERTARIRSQERAELAARVHDSVLQTLALIQRRADEPNEVRRLARVEERSLRTWLYGGHESGPASLSAAITSAAAMVELDYASAVEVVTVGDTPIDARAESLVAAAKEAIVNAAAHAGGAISVYVECSPAEAAVFVRDHGSGFTEADMPAHRRGVRDSIHGRMKRVGGTSEIRSGPNGTEVRLALPLGPRQEES